MGLINKDHADENKQKLLGACCRELGSTISYIWQDPKGSRSRKVGKFESGGEKRKKEKKEREDVTCILIKDCWHGEARNGLTRNRTSYVINYWCILPFL